MNPLNPKYITTQEGARIGVLLEIDEFEKILEELEAIRASDRAKPGSQEAVPIASLSLDAYKELERRMFEQVKHDKGIYLPCIPPNDKVDFVLIGMEPSLGTGAKCPKDAETKIEKGFKNFASSMEDFIVHFCIRRFLCKSNQSYYMTDLYKGAMYTKEASQNSPERYNRWFPLLSEEIRLVSKQSTKVIAIGQEVELFLKCKNVEKLSPTLTLLHYAPTAAAHRKKAIKCREREFEEFAKTINLCCIEQVAREVIEEADMDRELAASILARIGRKNLTTSRLMLAFAYKMAFEKFGSY